MTFLDFKAVEELKGLRYKAAIRLEANTNLNDFQLPGVYYVETPTNSPDNSETYYLTVYAPPTLVRPNGVRQELIDVSDGAVYSRIHTGGAWSEWTEAGTGGGPGGGASDAEDLNFDNTVTGLLSAEDAQAAIDEVTQKYFNEHRVFNVLDYGAIPNTETSDASAANRLAFENAILAATAVGGGVIRAPRGTYWINYGGAASVGGVRLRDNCYLVGDGMGITVIKAMDIGNNDMAGLVRTQSGIENENVVIKDLTIDANKQGQTGWANIICFFAGVTPDNRLLYDRDIYCINVECRNGKNGTTGSSNLSRGYGFDPHECVDRFVAINCHAHDCERDGFVLDGVLNFTLTSCYSYSNGRYGFNFITETFNGMAHGCHSTDNESNGFMVQGDSHHIVISGCRSENNAQQGIRIRRGANVIQTHCAVVNNLVKGNGRNGINITGAHYNLVANNLILDSSQAEHNTYMSVSLDEDDGDTAEFNGASFNIIQGNYAVDLGTNRAKAAYREDLSGAQPDQNSYKWNSASGQVQSKYLTLSPSANKVDDFRAQVYNAKDYGVIGDGTTDDRVALRDLVDLIEAAGGGTLFLPKSTYLVSGTGTASQGVISLPSNVNLVGEGMGVSIIKVDDMVDVTITGVVRTRSGAANTNITVRDLTVDCAAADQTGTGDITGLYVGGTADDNVTFLRVEAKNGHNGGANVGHGMRVNGTAVTNVAFIDCYSHNNERDGFAIDGAASKVRVINCRAISNGRYGVQFAGGAFDCAVSDSEARGNTTNNFVVLDNAYDIDFNGGVCAASGAEGMRIRRGDTDHITRVSVRGMRFALNARAGINIAGAHDNVIIGCHFVNNGQAENATYSDILLNQDAISAATNAEYNFIANNVFLATETAKTSYAIRETAEQADNTKAMFNTARGHVTSTYLLLGPASVFKDDSSGDGAAAGGDDTEFQFNNATVLDGAATLVYDTSGNRPRATNSIEFTPPSSAGSATSENFSLYSKARSDRIVRPAFVNTIGDELLLGGGMHRTIAKWQATNGNGTTPSQFGISMTAVGAAGVAPATTNRFTAARRIRLAGAATPNATATLLPNSANFVTRGNNNAVGGFYFEAVFALHEYSTNSRFFLGLANVTTALTAGGRPDAETAHYIGLSFGAGDTNWTLVGNDNTGAGAVLASLTNNAVIATCVDKLMRVIFYCVANDSTIYWYVQNISDGLVDSGSVSGSNLPGGSVYMGPQFGIHNGGDSAANSYDLVGFYLENGGLD